MKNTFLLIFGLLLSIFLSAQDIIELPYEAAEGIHWEGDSRNYYSDIWDTQVVTNVSVPTMQAFLPSNPNGTAVVVAPGGGLYALSINSEGNEVAKWLNGKGITAFVLKYRLVPTGSDGVKELSEVAGTDPAQVIKSVQPVMPYSVKDGLNALAYVRQHASEFGVNPNKIGFMGFSAGGAVTLGVAYNYEVASRPDFLVPVYPWTTAYPVGKVPEDAPPLLVICATDDPLQLAPGSVELYTSWLEAGKSAGLHMYARGGHGFGMKKQGLPSDNWIQRFYEWAVAEGITTAAP